MFNKLFMLSGTAILVVILLFGHDLASYITTSADWVGDSVRDQIPLEFELERARRMVSELTPEIDENRYAIAREEIEIERLAAQVANLQDRQEDEKVNLQRLQRELESGRNELEIGTTIYTSREATAIADKRFERFKAQGITLRSLEETVDARQRVLTAARKQLDATIATQEQWMVEISSLHARQKLNDAVRSSGDSNDNESQWERTCKLIQDIETRVKVEERLLEAEQHYSGEVAMMAEGSDSAAVAMAISDYFELGDTASIQTTTLAKVGTDDLTN